MYKLYQVQLTSLSDRNMWFTAEVATNDFDAVEVLEKHLEGAGNQGPYQVNSCSTIGEHGFPGILSLTSNFGIYVNKDTGGDNENSKRKN